MVLSAALAMARFSEWIPQWLGFENKLLANVLAFVAAMAMMIVAAWLIERLVLSKLVNQEGITLLMATLGIAYFMDGSGQTLFGNDIYRIDVGLPKDPMFLLESVFEGGLLVNKEDLYAAVIAAALVVMLTLFFQYTATGRALRAVADDHQAAQSIGIPLNRIWVIVSIVLAGLVAVAVFGNNTYFGELRVQQLSWSLLGPGLLVALVAGLAGGLFSRLVVASARGLPDRFSRWRVAHPLRFAAGCGLAVAVIGLVTGGTTAGAGYAPTAALLAGQAELPGVYTLLKFCATWLSAWSGVPAGVFAPSLAIGAGIGNDVALLTRVGPEAAIPLIALGMVGFLAATTQGPITAFIIVMEMVSGHAMVLSLMACSLMASGVARLITRPMYLELAALMLPAAPPPAAAPAADIEGRNP